MKTNLILYAILFLTLTNIQAQKKDIRLDIGFQRNIPERVFNRGLSRFDNRGLGLGFHVTPQWDYSPDITFKLSMDVNTVMGYYTIKSNDPEERWWVTHATSPFTIFSFTPTVIYYHNKYRLKPFIGFGAGAGYFLYHTPLINFGIRPVAGIKINKVISISFEYSRIFGHLQSDNYYERNKIYQFNHNMFSLNFSFSLGICSTGRP